MADIEKRNQVLKFTLELMLQGHMLFSKLSQFTHANLICILIGQYNKFKCLFSTRLRRKLHQRLCSWKWKVSSPERTLTEEDRREQTGLSGGLRECHRLNNGSPKDTSMPIPRACDCDFVWQKSPLEMCPKTL